MQIQIMADCNIRTHTHTHTHTHTNVHNCVMLYVICCKRGRVGREASPTWKEREGTHNDVGGALWLIAYVRKSSSGAVTMNWLHNGIYLARNARR